jgi:hypothetical protein
MQPTPLCGPKIVGILKAGVRPLAFPIYRGGAAGAADGHSVGRHIIAISATTKLNQDSSKIYDHII